MTPRIGTVAIGLLVSASLANASGGQELPAPPLSTIVTSGQATVRRAPDVAYIALGVESRARNPRDAQRQNAEAMAVVQKQLDALGIPRDARRTQGFWLQQQYDYTNGKQTPRDFMARNSLEIRVDDIARAGEIADAVVQGGATSLSGIQFDLKGRAGIEQEAIRLAVADARGRAEAAAAGAGRTLDRILKIEESRADVFIQPRGAIMMAAKAPTTAVEPGLIDIQAKVTLTASMK